MLGRGKEQGQATIIGRQTHEGSYRRGINTYAPTGQYHHVYDYVADVTPDDGGMPFRATFVEMFESDTEYRPIAADIAVVKIDPKDHAVKFDRKVLWEKAKAEKSSQHSAFDALSAAAAGTPAHPTFASNLAGASQIARKTVASRPAAVDPLERLQKLADLHTSGVLTDAEFADQKAKLLAET